MAKIFISYRREDTQWPVDRLRAALAPHVANPKEDIFVDIDNIPVGADFVTYINEQVGKCDVLLAVMGRQWLTVSDAAGHRRLDDPKDFVRNEIAAALKRGIPVVPVLVDDTLIPQAMTLPEEIAPLARRNGVKLRRETFDADAQRLIAGLKLPTVRGARKGAGWLVLMAVAMIAIAGVVAIYVMTPGNIPARVAEAAPEPATVPEGSSPNVAPEAGDAPATPRKIVVDFDRLDTNRPPLYEIAAAPFLHANAGVIGIEGLVPDTSRVVIRNNLGFYGGQALQPTVSQNFLTQAGIGEGACSFTLTFEQPVAAVTFRIPAIWAASDSGVTFPAWRATAFSARGEELAVVSSALARRMKDMPDGEAQDYTLRTPNFDTIASVRFDSDFRLDGRPFAAFEAVVIERIELDVMR